MWKYVMFAKGETNIPIIFPKILCHDTMAEVTLTNNELAGFKVVSAGFCGVTDSLWVCYGESETLGIKSRKEDSDIVTLHPWCHGLVPDSFTKAVLYKALRDNHE